MNKMFHNDSYALCDVALHDGWICSNINTLQRDRQDRPLLRQECAMDRGPGVASRSQDPRQGRAGGKNAAADRSLVFPPHDYHPNHGWCDFFVLAKPRSEIGL